MSNKETFMYRAKISSMKRKQSELRKYCLIMSMMFVLSIVMFILTVRLVVVNNEKYEKLKVDYATLNTAYETLKCNYQNMVSDYSGMYEEYEDMVNYTKECEDEINNLYNSMQDIVDQNKSLIDSNSEYFNMIQEYEKRSELYDKYEYCLYRTDGKRTDITYDQLITVEDLANQKGIDPDLVMSIVMVESEGKEKCTNSASTARGYGQFLKGTGKFTYEKLLGAGSYNHDYAFNGTTNLKMMVSYLDYLEDNTGSLYGAIKSYRGPVSNTVLRSYMNKIDSYLAKSGKSLTMINGSN